MHAVDSIQVSRQTSVLVGLEGLRVGTFPTRQIHLGRSGGGKIMHQSLDTLLLLSLQQIFHAISSIRYLIVSSTRT